MSYWAAGSAVVGAAGSYFGNKGNTPKPVSAIDSMPGFLQDDWQNIAGGIQHLQTPEYYGGQQIADVNPYLGGAWDNMYSNPAQNAMMGQAQMAGGIGMDAMSNLNDGFQYDQGVYDQTMANLMPAMQGSYDAATRDNNRNLNWNELTGLDMGMSAAGHQGSTKHAQGAALAQGMNMDRNADIGASMYQNATNQAQNAAMMGGQQSLNAAGQAANYGMQGMGMGFDMQQQVLKNQLAAGQGVQGYDQSLINADMDRFNFEQQAPWTALAAQNEMINANRLGSAPSPGPVGMNTWESLTGGAQAGLGLYQGGMDAGWWGGNGVGQPSANTFPDNSFSGWDGSSNGYW
jgi:hypothetical protein